MGVYNVMYEQSLWPGNKSSFTAPVFRRKTDLEEGFIGGGRWKYHVRSSDLYPETQIAQQFSGTEEDHDSVGDEAAIFSKDVAAGLLRMDILTRIQNIFEVAEHVKFTDSFSLPFSILFASDQDRTVEVMLNHNLLRVAMICSWVSTCTIVLIL